MYVAICGWMSVCLLQPFLPMQVGAFGGWRNRCLFVCKVCIGFQVKSSQVVFSFGLLSRLLSLLIVAVATVVIRQDCH